MSTTRRLDQRLTTIAFWVLVAAGLAGRIVLIYTDVFRADSDNAVVFLVSKHISEGDLSWFFWGQSYGGTLLEFAAGGAMLLFGTTMEVVSIVGVLFLFACVFLVREIATNAFDSRTTGNVAGVLFWFSGYWTIRVGISEPGFYGPSLLLGLLTIWLALRGQPRKSYLQWILIGLAFGLALWQSPMGAAVAAPGLVIAVVRHRSWRHWLVGAAAAILGALPWIISLTTSLSAVKPQVGGHGLQLVSFLTIFTRVLAMDLSVTDTVARYLVGIVALALLALLFVLGIIGLRRRNYWAATLAVSTVVAIVVIVLGTGTLLDVDTVRYAIFLIPYLAVTLAWLATRLPFTGLAAMVLVVALNIAQFAPAVQGARFGVDDKYVPGDVRALGTYLEGEGITAAYGDYWVSYAVTAETDEKVKIAAMTGPRRYEPYEEDAAGTPTATVIVFAGKANDLAIQSSTTLPPSTRTEFDGFAIYTFAQPFDPYLYPWMVD